MSKDNEEFNDMIEQVEKDLKKGNGTFWSKVARKVIILVIAALTAICGFGFEMLINLSNDLRSIRENKQSVEKLIEEVNKIKVTRKENFVLWKKIYDLNNRVDDNSVDQRVTQQLFQLMLNQGVIQIERVAEEEEEEFQEIPEGDDDPPAKGGDEDPDRKKSRLLIPKRGRQDPDEWRKEQVRQWEQQIKK